MAAIADEQFDSIIDTWAGPPMHATSAARLLGPRTAHYGYVSSPSVYTWPNEIGSSESHPVVEGDANSTTDDDYAVTKRGSELGVLAARPGALLARAGLILGPYEDIGRLPWWLQRVSQGGRVVAPGPTTRPLQYIDARDLAVWMLRCAEKRIGGVFNAVSPVGHTTMGELLESAKAVTGSSAELVWLTPEEIKALRIQPWTELPIWVPLSGQLAGLHDYDVSAAIQTGLHCRPIQNTIADTWAWLQAEGQPTQRSDRPTHGITPAREAEILLGRP